MNDLKEMSPEQLRNLIAEAKARLEEIQPPGMRWTVSLHRTRQVAEYRAIVVEAEDADTALAAAIGSQDRLNNEHEAWLELADEVTSFVGEAVDEGDDYCADYRIGADGKLEKVE
jgi:hypothetical protein